MTVIFGGRIVEESRKTEMKVRSTEIEVGDG